MIKRCVEVILSLLILLMLFPFLFIIALFIKLDSKGPVLLRQKRLGKNLKEFYCLKFRTMYVDSDDILHEHLLQNDHAHEEWARYKKLRFFDPRVTKVGSFLRRSSLDELPQLVNIIKGEMSFIGPRPYLPKEKVDMEGRCHVILSILPGMTGLWQVMGRNELSFKKRVYLDVWYVKFGTWKLDMLILKKTFIILFVALKNIFSS